MLIKFVVGELNELRKHAAGLFGHKNFHSFMAEVLARTDEDTGEVYLDWEDFEKIEAYKRKGHKKRLEKIFKRPTDEAFGKFFG